MRLPPNVEAAGPLSKGRPPSNTQSPDKTFSIHSNAWTAAEQRLHQQLQNGETAVISLRKDAHRNLGLWAAQRQLLIYIGRPGWALAAFNRYLTDHGEPRIADAAWANPFLIGRDGDRDEVIAKYAANLTQFRTRAPELQG